MNIGMDLKNDDVLLVKTEKGNVISRDTHHQLGSQGVDRKDTDYMGTNASVNTRVQSNAELLFGKYEKELTADHVKTMDDIKSTLKGIFDKMTIEDVGDLTEKGFDFKKVDVEELASQVQSMKEQLGVGSDGELSGELKGLAADEKVLKKIAAELKSMGLSASAGNVAMVLHVLQTKNMPTGQDNVADVVKAANTADFVHKPTDKEVKYMLHNGIEPTIDNMYKAQHAVVRQEEPKGLTDDEWKELRQQAYKVIDKAGLDINKENAQTARWLLDNKIPLTPENLHSYYQVKKAGEPVPMEELIGKIVDTMAQGKPAGETLLAESNLAEEAKALMNAVREISDADIENAVLNERPLTIHEFVQIRYGDVQSSNKLPTKEQEGRLLTAKRQMEEIRLKMTTEAGLQMLEKGIDVQMAPLGRIVEELRDREDLFLQKLLKDNDIDPTQENTNMLKETLEKVRDLNTMPSYLLGRVHVQSTVNELHEAGAEISDKLKNANLRYENLRTEIRPDLGDSLLKAFHNVDTLLAELGIEATMQNTRAAKILGYNRMEINEKNINTINHLDKKVNYMLENFNPEVALHMIRKGINPLNTPIDALNEQLKELNEKNQFTSEEKYSEFLWKLEQKNDITSDERQAFIGLFRLLHNIEKSDGSAVGSVVNMGKDVTLQNLLTAVRIKKLGGIDEKMDEQFGVLEDLKYEFHSITEQINQIFPNEEIAQQVEYNQQIISEVMKKITPGKLEKISKENDMLDLSLDKLNELLEQTTDEDHTVQHEYAARQLEAAKQVMVSSDTAIQYLLENEQSVTLNHMMTAKMLFDSQGGVFDKLKKKLEQAEKDAEVEELLAEAESAADSVGEENQLKEKVVQMSAQSRELIQREIQKQSISAAEVEELTQMGQAVDMMRNMVNEESYQVPVVIDGELTNIYLKFVDSHESNEFKIKASMDTEYLGKVDAHVTIETDNVRAYIESDSQEGAEAIRTNMDQLTNRLEEHGYHLYDYHVCYKGGMSNG